MWRDIKTVKPVNDPALIRRGLRLRRALRKMRGEILRVPAVPLTFLKAAALCGQITMRER